VIRNNALSQVEPVQYEAVVISPGPGNPSSAGMTMQFLEKIYGSIPILGVCLGMQCINELKGGTTIRAPFPVHGKTDLIRRLDNDSILLNGLPDHFRVARYHSLCCSVQDSSLRITSETDDSIAMSLEDKLTEVFAVQFHPESFLSDFGRMIMHNFITEIEHGH
jgi:anthranilate synthase/aminodeoxychorismate synthase-like glutamine amidotransferase